LAAIRIENRNVLLENKSCDKFTLTMSKQPLSKLRASTSQGLIRLETIATLNEPVAVLRMSADEYKAMIELAKNAVLNVKCVDLK
jgi:hypothetical protein